MAADSINRVSCLLLFMHVLPISVVRLGRRSGRAVLRQLPSRVVVKRVGCRTSAMSATPHRPAASAGGSPMPTAAMPAALMLATPAAASSTPMHSAGATPRPLAAARKISGSGLERLIAAASTTTSNKSAMPSRSSSIGRVAAGRGQRRCASPALAHLFNRCARAGQQVLRPEALDLLAVIVVLAFGQRCASRASVYGRVGALEQDLQRAAPVHAFQALADGVVERHADLVGQPFPGGVVHLRRCRRSRRPDRRSPPCNGAESMRRRGQRQALRLAGTQFAAAGRRAGCASARPRSGCMRRAGDVDLHAQSLRRASAGRTR